MPRRSDATAPCCVICAASLLRGVSLIRIVHVITRSDTVGGAQVHVAQLVDALRNQGHEASVLVGGEGPFIDFLRVRQIPVQALRHLMRPIHPWRDLRALFELRNRLQELKPDLVALHSSKAGWLGRVAARSLGYPVVFTAHGWAFTEGVGGLSRRVYRLAESLTAPLAHRIIAVSDYDRQLALRLRIAPEDRITTVHNGVPQRAERADPAVEPCRLIMVARLDHPKDQTTLVRVLGDLQHLNWHLDLVGDGPKREEIAGLIHQLGLQDRVHITGYRDDVPALLARASLCVLLSQYEGLPLSILEAMRTGLPVIASDVGGVRETVQDGVNGYLIQVGDNQTLRDRLERLIGSPSLRSEFGTASYELFLREFTEEQMVTHTLAVYREAMAGRAGETARMRGGTP